jgi:hypothetical protein
MDDNTSAVLERLDRLEAMIEMLLKQQQIKDWYTAEVAETLGKAEFTVREWCWQGRIRAEKQASGRGKYQSWVVSHAELERYRREGLLPRLRRS